jgi:hypothetical protein
MEAKNPDIGFENENKEIVTSIFLFKLNKFSLLQKHKK